MKIHIIGVNGSGKTYLAERLSKKYGIPHYDLDDIVWDDSEEYGVANSPEERDRQLSSILSEDNWIVEGIYYKWLDDSFKDADNIYILDVHPIVYKFRLIKRYVKRKLGLEETKKEETIQSLREVLKWSDRYNQKLNTIKNNLLDTYSDKVKYLTNNRDIENQLR